MAVNRQTSWTDDTEVQVTTAASLVHGIRVMKNRAMGTGVFWVALWNVENPDLAANLVSPDLILYVPGPTTDRRFSMKVVFPGGIYFDTGLTWFAFETTNDFGDAVTGNNVPVLDLYYDVVV